MEPVTLIGPTPQLPQHITPDEIKLLKAHISECEMAPSLVWKPDIALLDTQGLHSLSGINKTNSQSQRSRLENLQLVSALLIQDALTQLSHAVIYEMEGHYRRYYYWMQSHLETLYAEEDQYLPPETFQDYLANPKKRNSLYERVERESAEGAFTVHMGRNIAKILRKEVDPFDVVFSSDGMAALHDDILYSGEMKQQLKAYLSLLPGSQVGLRVLEIGAGTGSCTAIALDTLPAASQYYFTDRSDRFFEHAKRRFHGAGDNIFYQTLDIEEDPTTQGVEPGQFDLVIAANIIHTTANPGQSLKNCLSVLKPGGKLILGEWSKPELLPSSLAFGLLPDWWSGTGTNRRIFPLSPPEHWEMMLRNSGFSGIDVDITDVEDPELARQHVMISSAPAQSESEYKDSLSHETVIVCRSLVEQWTDGERLKHQILEESPNSTCSTVNIGNVEVDFSDKVCILLLDLPDMSAEHIPTVQNIFEQSSHLLWVTCDSNRTVKDGTENCIPGVFHGGGDGNTNWIVLTMSSTIQPIQGRVRAINKLSQHILSRRNGDRIREYRYEKGVFLSPQKVSADS